MADPEEYESVKKPIRLLKSGRTASEAKRHRKSQNKLRNKSRIAIGIRNWERKLDQ